MIMAQSVLFLFGESLFILRVRILEIGKEKQKEKEEKKRKGEIEGYILRFIPRWHQGSSLGQTKARSQELLLELPHEQKGPSF